MIDWRQTGEARLLYKVARDVHRHLWQRNGWWFDVDDLVTAAWLEVVRYCPPEKLRFASVNIRKEMIRYATRERKAMGTCMGSIGPEDSMGVLGAILDGRSPSGFATVDLRDTLAWLRRRVPANERTARAVQLRCCDGLTLKQTGKELGLTRERVRQIVNNYLLKVRRFIEGHDPTLDGLMERKFDG